jgi:erythronate-4-phosphate dehydrogenase
VRSVTRVNEALLSGSNVSFVGSCTIGEDHIDIDWLDSAGIRWASAPGSNADAVVDYVIACILILEGRVPQRRVGIVGLGNVGRRLSARLDALGVPWVGCDPFIDGAGLVGIDELIEQVDIVCLHTPLTSDGPYPTLHLLNDERLQKLRHGAILLNAGRGAVIDNQALELMLGSRKDLAVVLDVWESEPDINQRLVELARIATPHIAGHSRLGKLNGVRMIWDAFRQHFSMVDRQENPLGEQPLVGVSVDYQACGSLCALVEQVSGIEAEHHRFVEGMLKRRLAFDELRRTYIPRMEFSECELTGAQGSEREKISASGFKFHHAAG